jgi:NAD-dependent deacetylase
VNAAFSPALHARLRQAERIVAFTGAGISAESGVPTFRGPEGIWARFKPEELASMDAFMKNPDLVWEWYAHRRGIISGVEPNAGHRALARMERLVPGFSVVTQNIDNLHSRAGSRRVIELHGNIERNYCMSCGTPWHDTTPPSAEGAPSCGLCGGRVRPDVVWFGEMLPEEEWGDALRAAEGADLFFSIGTSALVYPAAGLPSLAKRSGAFLVEVNPERTPLTPEADEFLQGGAALVLPALVQEMEDRPR